MKHWLPFLILAGTAPSARAQQAAPAPAPGRNQLSVGAFGLAPNAGVQFHSRLGRFGTLGAQASYYFAVDYPGVQTALVGRYYFAGQAPTGLYAQAAALLAWHQGPRYATGNGRQDRDAFTSGGATLGVGYQMRLGTRWLAQAGAGFKYVGLRTAQDAGPEGRWEEPGQPGSPLDAQLSVGYLL